MKTTPDPFKPIKPAEFQRQDFIDYLQIRIDEFIDDDKFFGTSTGQEKPVQEGLIAFQKMPPLEVTSVSSVLAEMPALLAGNPNVKEILLVFGNELGAFLAESHPRYQEYINRKKPSLSQEARERVEAVIDEISHVIAGQLHAAWNLKEKVDPDTN